MASPRVKSGSIFYRNKRIAMMQNITYTIRTGDSQEMVDAGTVNTDGKTTTEISCDTIVPIAGVGVSIVQDAVDHNDVDLTLGIIDGKIHELEACRATEIQFSGEVATGKLTGRFSWFGAQPKITG